jgi:hypothetical protein
MRLSDELEDWLRSDADKTLGGLIDLFGERSFAILLLRRRSYCLTAEHEVRRA